MNIRVPTRGNMTNDAAQILLPKNDSLVYSFLQILKAKLDKFGY